MATVTKIGGTFFVSGSSMEGAAYARHFAQQSMQDFDFMLVEGKITSPDCLLKLKDTEAYVQVKYDEKYIEQFTKTSFSTKQNQNGILCINGFNMKEKYSGTHSISFLPTSTLLINGHTSVNSASTEITFESYSTTISLGEQFENTLNSIRRMKVERNVENLQENYKSACDAYMNSISQYVLPLFSLISNAQDINLETFKDIISLTSPICNIRIPNENRIRLNNLLEFYEKYKYLGNPMMLEDYIEYGQSCIDNEADFVPALQLDFWPNDVKVFLDRIRLHRPVLYKLITETASIHLIPKWSKQTSEIDQELEFRYSFSDIERLLATNRTRIEQILNGVARSIYYKYLKNEPSLQINNKNIIPSYFIKTTVLWMCELMDLNDQFGETDNNQIIARMMAQKWIDYVVQLLSTGICKHYFIDGLNLLESCPQVLLDKARDILQHEINLDEDIIMDIFTKQNELVNKHRLTTEEWIGNLKVADILDAMNNYTLLKEKWLNPSRNILGEDDAIGCLHILNQLRTLDGNKQENWIIFKRLFLDVDQTNWSSAIWNEQVQHCSISNFVDGLLGLSSMLNHLQLTMEKPNHNGRIEENINSYELAGTQNILNDLIAPSKMVRNGLMTCWLPFFTCSHFNTLPTGISSDDLSSFQNRSIITDHPIGPLNNLLQDRSLPSTIDSSTRQAFYQHSQQVSNNFLNLLYDAPDSNMTLNDLIKYYDKPQTPIQTVRSASLPKQILSYATNPSVINKEELTLIVFDPNLDIKNIQEDFYRTINDYVLFYADKCQLLSYIQSISEEKIFLIIFDSSLDTNFLSQLQNLNQVHSFFIYSFEENTLINDYSKLIDIYKEKTLLFEHVRIKIEQQSTLTIALHDPKQIFPTYSKLSKENALFIWNLLLKDLLMNNQSINQNVMIEKCRDYYNQNPVELENLEEFEKTYQSTNAHQWYFKHCFISKQLNKAFHIFDIEQLKLFSSFINDLTSNIESSSSSIDRAFYTAVITKNQFEMLLKGVGKLITFNGFLIMNHSSSVIAPQKSDEPVVVRFEIVNSYTSCSILNDSNRIIFNLGTTFLLDSFDFDNNLELWNARLLVHDDGRQIAQNYIITKQQTMERMTLPIIMGELLLTISDLSKTKIYFENLENEDDALIYYYYGLIHYSKGEYDSALENYQISYQLMISEERTKDSAFVLHGIGYVYDMKKEFNDAFDSHCKALEIRKTFFSENDVEIGISFYNIGRTLVNMGDNEKALVHHQKALHIWEQTLAPNHLLIAQSLHSHGVVYFNRRDYPQALSYYTKALELYEAAIVHDDHCILMVKNTLEIIKDLCSQQ